jgi:hypothetical protein
MYYVYCYIDPRTNEIFYIGKGKKNRKYSHLNETLKNTCNKRKFLKIQEIIQSNQQPIIKELASFENEKDAYNFEISLIKKYGRIDLDEGGILTNMTVESIPPSRKGKKLTEEQKEKLRKPLSQERRNKLKGKIPWNKGLKGQQEAWNKGLKGIPGRVQSAETKEKLRQLNLGKTKSKETREKMSKNMKGRSPWNKGKILPSSAVSISCIFISPEGIIHQHPSYRQGCLTHNLPTSKISEMKNGLIENYKGWRVADYKYQL